MKAYRINSKVGLAIVATDGDSMVTITKKSISIEKGAPLLGSVYEECSKEELVEAVAVFQSKLKEWSISFQEP